MKRSIIIAVLMAMAMITTKVYAQNTATDTARANVVSKQLGIGKDKAQKLIVVLRFNQDKIETAIKSQSLKASQKQLIVQQLLSERENRINALLSPGERAMLRDTVAQKAQRQRGDFEAGLKKKKDAERGKESKKSKQ